MLVMRRLVWHQISVFKTATYFFLQFAFRTKSVLILWLTIPDSKVHGANLGPTWVLSAPDGPHVDPMNLAIWDTASVTLEIFFFEAVPSNQGCVTTLIIGYPPQYGSLGGYERCWGPKWLQWQYKWMKNTPKSSYRNSKNEVTSRYSIEDLILCCLN